jgi:hypothetical protein
VTSMALPFGSTRAFATAHAMRPLTTVLHRLICELALCSLYGTRLLPALASANDPVLTANVDFVYGVDGGTDAS